MERHVEDIFGLRTIIMAANALDAWHGGGDVSLSRTEDGWYEVKAFAGYDGFAIKQYDNIEEAYEQFDDWRTGIDDMVLRHENKQDVDTD